MEKSENHLWPSREVARLLSLVEADRRYYEDILTVLPVPVAIVKAHGQFVSANRAFLRQQQLKITELGALSLPRVLPAVPPEPGVHGDWHLLRIERWDEEASDLVLVHCPAAPAEEAPAARAAVSAFALQEAATLASAKLAGRVLHEANNLLMVLSGYGEEILDALPPASPLREDMREILRSTDRIKGMSAQLQSLAAPPKPVRTSFDLVPFLQALSAREPALVLRTALPSLLVNADRSHLEQSLLTLARHAARPLELVLQAPATLLLSGLPDSLAEDLELLSPAARASNGALSAIPALLLGSGIQWRTLPSALQLAFTTGALTAGPAKRILVVDDEEGIRTLVRKVLERQGFQVSEAESGAAALGLLEREGAAYDLLVSDMMMPGMDGRTLAGRVSQLRPGIRILFISGYTDDAEVQSGRLPAGTAFLPKPFQHSALLDAVNRLLA